MDPLADRLKRSAARGTAFGRIVLAQPWGLMFEAPVPVAVHLVLGGEAWVASGSSTVRVLAGEIALTRGPGTSHVGSCPQPRLVPATNAIRRFGTDGGEIVLPGEPGAVLICGIYTFSGELCDSIRDGLPPVLHLRGSSLPSALRSLHALAADEIDRPGPGAQAVLDRLLDLVLVNAVRSHYANVHGSAPGWYRALGDAAIRSALCAIHQRPAHGWTVARLAAAAGLSRAAFARRFADLVGQTPLAYLTSWRMQLAQEQLRDSHSSIAEIANAIGYGNEFAFSAAFRRHTGLPPGRWRRRANDSSREAGGFGRLSLHG